MRRPKATLSRWSLQTTVHFIKNHICIVDLENQVYFNSLRQSTVHITNLGTCSSFSFRLFVFRAFVPWHSRILRDRPFRWSWSYITFFGNASFRIRRWKNSGSSTIWKISLSLRCFAVGNNVHRCLALFTYAAYCTRGLKGITFLKHSFLYGKPGIWNCLRVQQIPVLNLLEFGF